MYLNIKGYQAMKIKNILLDYNGTIATDGKLSLEIKEAIQKLSNHLRIHIITANTNESALEELKDMPVDIFIIKGNREDIEKQKYLYEIGNDKTIAVGNGYNDALILKDSIIGIGVIGEEGIAKDAFFNCDIVVKSGLEALELLLKTNRLIATMRK